MHRALHEDEAEPDGEQVRWVRRPSCRLPWCPRGTAKPWPPTAKRLRSTRIRHSPMGTEPRLREGRNDGRFYFLSSDPTGSGRQRGKVGKAALRRRSRFTMARPLSGRSTRLRNGWGSQERFLERNTTVTAPVDVVNQRRDSPRKIHIRKANAMQPGRCEGAWSRSIAAIPAGP